MPDNQPPKNAPTRPKLLFVHSGSVKKRLTFETAAEMGVEIYLLNANPGWADTYAQETIYTHGKSLADILTLVEELHQRVTLTGVVTFWEEDVPTCAHIAHQLGLPGNTPQAAMNARSKYLMREALQNAGVPVPNFRLITGEESLIQACKELKLPAVLKPEWGADSEWVTRVETAEHALQTYRENRNRARVQDSLYPYPPARFVLEEFLSGPEVSIEGVVKDGQITLYAIIDKAKMDDGSFIERGETTPSRFPQTIQNAIRDMVVDGVNAQGLTHSGIHAEIKLTPKGPRIVEIGARMGGDCIQPLVKRVYGINLAEENIRVALSLPIHASVRPKGWGISTTLVPEQPGQVHIKPIRYAKRNNKLIEIVYTKQDGDRVEVPPVAYDNLGWVSVWGKNYTSAKRSLDLHTHRVARAFDINAHTPVMYGDVAD
ncbi:MAG: biotin carboxylase [Candidatus Latescibacterota bacterium]|jgi:biotin carboxylase